MRNSYDSSASEGVLYLVFQAYTVLLLIVKELEDKKACAITPNAQSWYKTTGSNCNHKVFYKYLSWKGGAVIKASHQWRLLERWPGHDFIDSERACSYHGDRFILTTEIVKGMLKTKPQTLCLINKSNNRNLNGSGKYFEFTSFSLQRSLVIFLQAVHKTGC